MDNPHCSASSSTSVPVGAAVPPSLMPWFPRSHGLRLVGAHSCNLASAQPQRNLAHSHPTGHDALSLPNLCTTAQLDTPKSPATTCHPSSLCLATVLFHVRPSALLPSLANILFHVRFSSTPPKPGTQPASQAPFSPSLVSPTAPAGTATANTDTTHTAVNNTAAASAAQAGTLRLPDVTRPRTFSKPLSAVTPVIRFSEPHLHGDLTLADEHSDLLNATYRLSMLQWNAGCRRRQRDIRFHDAMFGKFRVIFLPEAADHVPRVPQYYYCATKDENYLSILPTFCSAPPSHHCCHEARRFYEAARTPLHTRSPPLDDCTGFILHAQTPLSVVRLQVWQFHILQRSAPHWRERSRSSSPGLHAPHCHSHPSGSQRLPERAGADQTHGQRHGSENRLVPPKWETFPASPGSDASSPCSSITAAHLLVPPTWETSLQPCGLHTAQPRFQCCVTLCTNNMGEE